MVKQYIAFDLGAGSGRVSIGELNDDGYLQISQLHRFPNEIVDIHGNLYWNILGLYQEMLKGLRLCAQKQNITPVSIGIDTWGSDYTLLDEQGSLIGMPFCSRGRDSRGVMNAFLTKIPNERLYSLTLTGAHSRPMNTLCQLYSMVQEKSPQLQIATALLFIPDVFNYFLTGVKKTEFTIATISQLYNPQIKAWEEEIIKQLGVSKAMMQEVVMPGTIIGELNDSVTSQTGLKNIQVVAVASHDSSSALAATPVLGKNSVQITCGTMSLIGFKSSSPIINKKTLEYSLSNDGGICGTFMIVKIMSGLWLLQECKKEWAKARNYSYRKLIEMAKKAVPIGSIIDPDRYEFRKPVSMLGAIESFLGMTGQPIPQNIGQFVRVIIESLALAYRYALELLEDISGKKMKRIHIVGGGSQNTLLCQCIADATGLPVYAGPAEATIIGNILIQAMAFGHILSFNEMREVIKRSFYLNLYEPRLTSSWDGPYERFLKLKLTCSQ